MSRSGLSERGKLALVVLMILAALMLVFLVIHPPHLARQCAMSRRESKGLTADKPLALERDRSMFEVERRAQSASARGVCLRVTVCRKSYRPKDWWQCRCTPDCKG